METLTTLLATALPALIVWGAVDSHLRWMADRARGRTALAGWVASTVAVAALTAWLLGVAAVIDLAFGLATAVTATGWAVLSRADRMADERRRQVPAQRCG